MSNMSYEIVTLKASVKAWPKIQSLIGDADAHVAGGYAAWHMSDRFNDRLGNTSPYEAYQYDWDLTLRTMLPSNRPNDLDIFTYDEAGYSAIVGRLEAAGFQPLKESKYCTTWIDTAYLKQDNESHLRECISRYESESLGTVDFRRKDFSLPIQLIKPVFGKNLYEVMEHFDFYAAKVAILDEETALVHKDAVKCIKEQLLTCAHPEHILVNPFHVLGRTVKYVRKGYKVNYMEMLRLVTTAQTQDVEQLKREELQEIVQHLAQYLRSGNSLGRGEDFRPTFEGAYEEWARCLLSKKAKL